MVGYDEFCVQGRVVASTHTYTLNLPSIHPLPTLPRPHTLCSPRRNRIKNTPIKHASNILFHHAPIFRPQHKPRRRPCIRQ
jgi:hypothetical protein